MSVSALTKSVEELVPIALARAGWEKRRVEAETGGEEAEEQGRDFTPVMTVVLEAIAKVRKGELDQLSMRRISLSRGFAASSEGDPRLRLEKYFSSLVCVQLALLDLPDADIVYSAQRSLGRLSTQ